jgi:hypothetical protein
VTNKKGDFSKTEKIAILLSGQTREKRVWPHLKVKENAFA